MSGFSREPGSGAQAEDDDVVHWREALPSLLLCAANKVRRKPYCGHGKQTGMMTSVALAGLFSLIGFLSCSEHRCK